jgi:putative redox protein
VKTLRHLAHAVGSTGSEAPAFRVELASGQHHLLADEPVTAGGGDVGPTPLGLLASSLAACTAMTLRMYAAHKGWDLATISVEVTYNVDESDYTSIERTISVPPSLSADQRQRLAEIATRTPVTLAIRTPIATTVEPGLSATSV